MRSQNQNNRPKGPRSAALFVDLDDLYSALQGRLPRGAKPETVLVDALRALPNFLGRSFGARLQSGRAYGDFAAIEGGADLQRSLYNANIESVYAAGPRNAAELALVMDAAVALNEREGSAGMIVVVSGTRSYGVLARRARATGRRFLVVSAEPREDASDTISLFDLTPDASKGVETAAPREPRVGIEYKTIESASAMRALEVIEEFFGQYDEVYLTPLLRKLTEEMGEEGHDPKALVSDLDTAGAVYLEKRRGFPHDYTVLLVDGQHPDVVRVKALFDDFDDEDDDAPYAPEGDGASEYAEEDR